MAEQVIIPLDVKLEEFIMDYVHNHGYPHHKSRGYHPVVIVRTFSDKNIGRVLGGGTDRDFSSQMHHSGHSDAIRQQGLGAGDVIYATVPACLPDRLRDGSAIAAYDSEKLEVVPHCGPIYKERCPHTFNDALIAVFSNR